MIARLAAFLATRIGRKIMAMIGVVVALGLAALVAFYAQRQQDSILAQQERTLTKVTESVAKGLRTVMLAGYADIGHALFERLRGAGDNMDIRILRPDGIEAFNDNVTIAQVNDRLGDNRFRPRDVVSTVSVFRADDPNLRLVVETADSVAYRDEGDLFTMLAPIVADAECAKCHGQSKGIRGLLKVSTSLAPVREDIRRTWIHAILILAVAMVAILASINILIRRTVVTPIGRVTDAMMRAAHGDLTQQVPVLSRDELGEMAVSFNHMIKSLLEMYSGLEQERNKLATLLLGAEESIVVTDGEGRVVLVNPAAERLLGKTSADIATAGFDAILDEPGWIARRLETRQMAPELFSYRGLVLSVLVAGIESDDGRRIGCAALIRDVTQETHLREELQRMSETDALTGLYNRRFFDEKMADELALARRYGKAVSLFVFDVDHFKKFNDTYGHDQGDRVLQGMGRALRQCAARTDIVCRYGGEEFVCILPGAGREEAMAAAERLRGHVEAMQVDGLSVTISIGVATFPDLDFAKPEDMVKGADSALYKAKEGGRNCVRALDPAMA